MDDLCRLDDMRHRLRHLPRHVTYHRRLHTLVLCSPLIRLLQFPVTTLERLRLLFDLPDIARQRLLHGLEAGLQLTDLVDTVALMDGTVEMLVGDTLCRLRQVPERSEVFTDDTAAEHDEEEDADGGDRQVCPFHTDIRGDDITLLTDDRHAPLRVLERFIEHITVLSVYLHLLMPRLPVQHRITERPQRGVRFLEGAGEDRLIEQAGRVRMDEEGASPAQQDAIGVRIRLRRRYRLREPVEADIHGEGAYGLTPLVVDRLTVRGKDIVDDDTHGGILHIRLQPVRSVQESRNEVPVHSMVLVLLISLLLCQYVVAVVI